MQVFDDTNDPFLRIPQILADLMSEIKNHEDDQEKDGRMLYQYDEELCALRSIQNQLERYIASVRRKRNALAPINVLPRELLVTVFTFAIEGDDYETDQSNHETLMLVCDFWNHMVNDTPSLWTNIHKTDANSHASVIRALEKSKNYPLELYYCNPNLYTDGMVKADQVAFLNAIFPHAHRWRTVALWLDREAQGMEPMATLSAPLLESLSLYAGGYSGGARDEPLDIFGGRPPARLQELNLCGIAVPWSPKTLCNLKVLSIESILRHGPSLNQLFAVLSASPSLESLSLQAITFSGAASTLLPDPIHMLTLGKLFLRISPEITNQLLAAIHAPNCKRGSLDATIQGDPFESFFTPDVSHFFNHIRSGADAGSISCGSRRVWVYWQGSWTINANLDGIRAATSVLNWLSISPEPTSPVPLHLTISESDPPLVEDILAEMADMEAAQRITLQRITFGHATPLVGVLRMLSTGSSAEGGARGLFPALNEMKLNKPLEDEEWDYLLRMLRRRQEEIEGSDCGEDIKPIRRVVFGGDWYTGDEQDVITKFRSIYWPDRLEEVRRLLGPEGELEWYGRRVAEDGDFGDQSESQYCLM